MLQSKKEYLKAQAFKYDMLETAETHAKKLERDIKNIRDLGFKVIVLGSQVKVTLNANI